MKKVHENLNSLNGSYLFPFFWQHGESEETLSEYIEQMYSQGIRNFCIESRPHPDFLKDNWWKTLTHIINEAKQKNMKMWILDDAKFPTGYANGQVPNSLKKTYLNFRRFDIAGNNSTVQLNLNTIVDFREFMKDSRHKNDRFFKAILVENKVNNGTLVLENIIGDISNNYFNGILSVNLKDKHYSVFVLYITEVGEAGTKDYLDPMRKEATQILIDEVYEKHYAHLKEEFGKTIIGFFSDEPRFGNIKGTNASIGRIEMSLPWNEEVYQSLKDLNDFKDDELIYLFHGESKIAHKLRFEYMNIITTLYSDNFSKMIGEWCKSKGVDYVGHTIEDNGAHARLGYGTGHYFRGIAGQSIAGIDIIGGQVVPGMDYQHEAFSTGGSDGEFYHYALARLGASSAKLDSAKRGVLMCEAFGAYGWIEGLKMMKWITDHMLSHGVNLIVPHAFNPAPFPDWDCPPHFYAHGMNPQYPYFNKWSSYTDRLCHLLNDGYHNTKVGVLYHAFSEWSGHYMPIQKVLKKLQTSQIEFDVISEDFLIESIITDKGFAINGHTFEILVVPTAEQLPVSLSKKLESFGNSIKLIYVNDIPNTISKSSHYEIVELDKLNEVLEPYKTFKTSKNTENLVVYHYTQNDGEIYFLTNEDINKTIDIIVEFEEENLSIYDPYTNTLSKLMFEKEGNKISFPIVIEPYQSLVLVSDTSDHKRIEKSAVIAEISKTEVAYKRYNEEHFTTLSTMNTVDHFPEEMLDFSGQIKYKFELEKNEAIGFMELGAVSEIVELIINGESIEVLIAPPYLFNIKDLLVKEINTIELIVTNNLARSLKDPFSQYLPMEPIGIRENIKIWSYKD